jgi:nucleotide-binding universal stress UspA family protein
MRRHRSILVVLDGSEAGFGALSESIRLAQWSRGWATAMVVAPPYEGDLSLVGVQNVRAAILGSCEAILDRAVGMAESMGARIEVACEEGEPHSKVSGYADSRGLDLIVLGCSREYSFLKVFTGSAVSRLIETGRRDVLIIPEGASLGWEQALLAMDESDGGGSLMDRAVEVAASYGSGLTALFIENRWWKASPRNISIVAPSGDVPGERILRELKARALTASVSVDAIREGGPEFRVIRRVTRRLGIQVAMVGWRGRTGLKSLLRGRGIEAVLRGVSCPVLVLGE